MSSTRFVSTSVNVGRDLWFTIDGNSKVTANNGDYYEPAPNALSLPHESCCPGATPTCLRSCYVGGLRRHAPDVYESYRHNERVLHRVLMTPGASADAALDLGLWISANCRGGFRWHVAGDIIHDRHARWIRDVCGWSPDVRHWIYTKTLEVVPLLVVAQNLTVNVSADRDNFDAAARVAAQNGCRLCYMAGPEQVPSLPDGSVIFPDYPQRGRDRDDPTEHPWWKLLTPEQRRMVCPADFFGQSPEHRCGPCQKCLTRGEHA